MKLKCLVFTVGRCCCANLKVRSLASLWIPPLWNKSKFSYLILSTVVVVSFLAGPRPRDFAAATRRRGSDQDTPIIGRGVPIGPFVCRAPHVSSAWWRHLRKWPPPPCPHTGNRTDDDPNCTTTFCLFSTIFAIFFSPHRFFSSVFLSASWKNSRKSSRSVELVFMSLTSAGLLCDYIVSTP